MELLTQRVRVLLRFLGIAGLVAACSIARAAPPTEYQIQAAFIFNFAQFVHWPAESFGRADAPMTIGILGDDPFGRLIDETVQGGVVDQHPMRIIRAKRVEDLRDCQIVYVSASERQQVPHILDVLKDRPVLTIGAAAGFAQAGGVIGFFRDGTKVRFEINPGAAETNHLKINSQMLKLARIVGTGPRQGDT